MEIKQKPQISEKSEDTKPEILPLTEDEKFKMTEDLITDGYCTYKFNISNLDFLVKSLVFNEQKQLTQTLSSIPKIILDEGGTRDKTISEYNLDATEAVIKAQLVSIQGKTEIDLGKMSKHILAIISSKIRLFNNTIDTVLLSVDNIKN